MTPSLHPSLQINHAKVDQALGISSLGSRVFSDTFGYSVDAHDLEEYLQKSYNKSKIEKEISDPHVHFIVATINQEVVGFAQLTEGTIEDCIANAESPVELQRLYLDPSQHGTGLARKLFEEIESIAKSRDFRVMWLGVWEHNVKAQKFYKKMGFSRVGEHDFKTGNCIQTDWIMSKPL